MNKEKWRYSNLWLGLVGLSIALAIAVFLSPFVSRDPDGLDRVAQDLQFEHKAIANPPAQKLPFAKIFNQYTIKGMPEQIATPLAGLLGTLVTFTVAWGLGKIVVNSAHKNE